MPRPLALREMGEQDRYSQRNTERFAERNRASEQSHVHNGEQVISIGEESFDVSTRRIVGGTTRVRRVVRERPVERHIELHDESVVVERQAPNGQSADIESLVEREYAMSDSREVPVVTKQFRLRGQVVLRKETNNRVEVVRDVVRYADVEVEQPQRMPVVAQGVQIREHTEQREQPTTAQPATSQPTGEHVEMHREHHERYEEETEQRVSGFQEGTEAHREHDAQHGEQHRQDVREPQE